MNHDSSEDPVWLHAWEIFTDPSHIIAELGWTIIQDVLIIGLLYGLLFKKVILPRIRKTLAKEIHEEIDKEHGHNHEK